MPPRPRPVGDHRAAKEAAGASFPWQRAEEREQAEPSSSAPDVVETAQGDVALRENGEEAVYVYLDLSEMPANVPWPETSFEVKGLDGEKPEIRFQDGTVMEGAYQDTLGSQIFLDASASSPAQASKDVPEPRVVGLSEKTIRFHVKPPDSAPGSK